MSSNDNHLRAISQEMPQPLITKVSLKIYHLIFFNLFLRLSQNVLAKNFIKKASGFGNIGPYILFLWCHRSSMKQPKSQTGDSTKLIDAISIAMTSWWARWRLKSPASRVFVQPFVQTQIKENIIAPRHWPLWGEFTGDRWIPRTKGL